MHRRYLARLVDGTLTWLRCLSGPGKGRRAHRGRTSSSRTPLREEVRCKDGWAARTVSCAHQADCRGERLNVRENTKVPQVGACTLRRSRVWRAAQYLCEVRSARSTPGERCMYRSCKLEWDLHNMWRRAFSTLYSDLIMSLPLHEGPAKVIFGVDIGSTSSELRRPRSATPRSFMAQLQSRLPTCDPAAHPQSTLSADGPRRKRYLVRSSLDSSRAQLRCDVDAVKFPSAVMYDVVGEAVAFGAAAFDTSARSEGMHCVTSFKLGLHPEELRSACQLQAPPFRLPRHVLLQTVYKDFIGHACRHAVQFFQDTQFDGRELWTKLSSSFELVFAIPNGWAEEEQCFIRNAVVAAGILPPEFAENRLAFVSEAEASVHFALSQTDFASHMTSGKIVVHCEALLIDMNIGRVFAVLDAGEVSTAT